MVFVPIYKNEEQFDAIAEKVAEISAALKAKGVSVKFDKRDTLRPGAKFAEWELKGVPLRIAMGARDLENGTVEIARRDTFEKQSVAQEAVVDTVLNLLETIQEDLFASAKNYRDEHTTVVDTFEEFKAAIENKGGFVSAHWDGTAETENKIKELTKATIRCIPLDALEEEGKCVYSGQKSTKRVLFAKAY